MDLIFWIVAIARKTSYIAFGGLLGTIAFFLIFIFKNSLPSINLPLFGNQPYLFVAIAFFLGGTIGVIYYKLSNRKPLTLKTVILFWIDK